MTAPRPAAAPRRRLGPRAAAPRRSPGRLVRPRPHRPLRRRRRALAAVLATLLAALALWLLLRDPPPAVAPPPPPPPVVAAPARPPPRPAARPRPPAPAPAPATPSPRDRLLAAIRDRSVDLAACQAAPGSPTQAPVRLRIGKDGAARAVFLEGARPLPAPLAACLRERILAWRFEGLGLTSDVEVLVTFSLASAPAGAT